jgi:hypothetical protein
MKTVASDSPKQVLDEQQELLRRRISNPTPFNSLIGQRAHQLIFKTRQQPYGSGVGLRARPAALFLRASAMAAKKAKALKGYPYANRPADTVTVDACLLKRS